MQFRVSESITSDIDSPISVSVINNNEVTSDDHNNLVQLYGSEGKSVDEKEPPDAIETKKEDKNQEHEEIDHPLYADFPLEDEKGAKKGDSEVTVRFSGMFILETISLSTNHGGVSDVEQMQNSSNDSSS